ncbi:SapC family protein [Allosphingosinicella flava]|uniref:SapC family protein n=1 Tax=Allosphingosinicella flava TaxID=2771430 RepID=A0A7T2GLH0_9SPHN|nr:SapC family protein [Sphingosinicella flava]QPQ56046.1 SapC family protein [Sphingosinicella flava]
MATAAPANQMPLFYNQLEPLSSNVHPNFKVRATDKAPFLAGANAIPVTVDEFVLAQRHYPIVFTADENPVPLALMGLNEGVNVYVDDEGKLLNQDVYVPAYIRRYPFMLARLQPDAQDLTLCFDRTADVVGEFEDGQALFDGDKPSETTQNIMKLCEDFEMSVQRTGAFVKELKDADLLIDGEVSIQLSDGRPPFIYRGFKMVAEDKLRELRGDALRKMNQSGMLPLIFAHLFSLSFARDIFGKQAAQGKGPDLAATAPKAEDKADA